MKRRSFRTACALSFVITAGWVSLRRADALRQLHRHRHQQRRSVRSQCRSRRDQRGHPGDLHREEQRPGPLHDLGPAHRHLRRPGAGPGLPSFETNPIRLESGQNARVDITLTVGASEQVEVTAVSPILQTQDAVVGEVISGTTIERMPLNGRNFSQLSLLLPGVITTEPNSFTEPKNFGAGRPFVNGQREQENNYTLDGVDMNEPIDNLLPYQPSPDALAEVRVETNNYSAEFGNVAGRGDRQHHQVRAPTSSTASSSSTGATAAWRPTRGRTTAPARKKAELSQHIFGGTIGGPIMKNKLFFFGDYQAFIRDRPGELVRTVAPEAWRRGDFSGVARRPSGIRSPGSRFPATRSTRSRFSPIARARARQPDSSIRCRTGPATTSNLVAPSSDKQRAHQGDVKIDVNLSDNDRHVRAVLLPEVQVRAGAGAAREQPDRHQRLAVPGPGVQLDAHAQRDDASTSCSSASRTSSSRRFPWTGPASATPTRRSAFRAVRRFPA